MLRGQNRTAWRSLAAGRAEKKVSEKLEQS
jgi:hypothetical protein